MNWLQSIGKWLIGILLNYGLGKVIGLITSLISKWKQDQANKENLRLYEEALTSGDKDAIAKAAERLLNGVSR